MQEKSEPVLGCMQSSTSQTQSSVSLKVVFAVLLQTELVEAHLEAELKARIPGFKMQTFVKSLK